MGIVFVALADGLAGVFPGESAFDISGNAIYTISTFRKKKRGGFPRKASPLAIYLKLSSKLRATHRLALG